MKKPETKPKGIADGIPVYCAHDAIVRAAELKPNPKNPNMHPNEQIARLGLVIRGNGWRNPITVSTRSGLVVKGHGRLLAALHEGLAAVPVDYQNYESEAAELADLTADNHLAELSETDERLLAEIFADIDTSGLDFDLTGYTANEYDEIAAALTDAVNNEIAGDPDEVPPSPVKPVTRHGDIWILGRHRLICGDATNKDDIAALLNGERAGLLLTDPPYGINYGALLKGKGDGHGGADKNGWKSYDAPTWDEERPERKMFDYMRGLTKHQIIWGGNYFADCLPPKMCWLVWDKGQREFSLADGELAWTNFDKALRIKTYSRALANREDKVHPTQKPLELLRWCLDVAERNGADTKKVLDIYAGSGSTLIVCEETGRTCFASELAPNYCDVIVKRYAKIAGGGYVQLKRNGKILPPSEYAEIFETT